MTITRIEFYCVGIVLLVVIVGGGFYLHYDKAGAVAVAEFKAVVEQQDARIKAAEQKAEEAAKRVPVTEKVESSRTSELDRALALIAAQKQQPVDYDELARRLREQFGAQAQIEKPPSNLPNAPSAVKIDAQTFRDYQADCDAGHTEALSCRKGLANKDSIIADKDTQLAANKDAIDALTTERDQAKKTITKLRGGSAFTRAMKDVGKIGIGIGIGYGLRAATH